MIFQLREIVHFIAASAHCAGADSCRLEPREGALAHHDTKAHIMLAPPVSRPQEAYDIMHYESRAVRKELKASNARVISARGSRPAATLAPLVGDQLEHEWHRLEVHSELVSAAKIDYRVHDCYAFPELT